MWGLPLDPLTLPEVLDEVDAMVADGRPHIVITANLNYVQR